MTHKENIDILEELELLETTSKQDNNTDNIFNETIINDDFLSENNVDDYSFNNEIKTLKIEEIEEEEKKYETIEFSFQTKKQNSIVSWLLFFIKYSFTSAFIFIVLLITTNYSAYTTIAKDYIFANDNIVAEQKLISSISSTNIKKEEKKETTLNLEQIEKEEEKEKKENKLSIKNIKKDLKDLNLNIEITPYENRVIIPKIGKNIPLLDIENKSISWESELNDIFMKELEDWIIRYPGSAKPGDNWTSFIFGHSSNYPWVDWDYNNVFALLDKVSYNDEVIVYYWQEKYTYKIKEKKVITPWDVSVLKRNNDKSEISLMTCWPVWTTLNRLIVTWELVSID